MNLILSLLLLFNLENGCIEKQGPLSELRPPFVTLQENMEEQFATSLENGEISTLDVIIHTPTPPTPFCKEQPRTTTCKKMIEAGAHFVAAYSYEREASEQNQYHESLKHYPIHEHKLGLEEFPADYIGATYLFKDKQGTLYGFSIAMAQINTTLETFNAKIWLGPIGEGEPIDKRVDQILNFLNDHGATKLHLLSLQENEVSQ